MLVSETVPVAVPVSGPPTSHMRLRPRPAEATRSATPPPPAAGVLLLLLLAYPTCRASIFVANRHPGCSDAGAGTQAAPLCSLAAALARSRARGDKDVVLRAGTFTLNATLCCSRGAY